MYPTPARIRSRSRSSWGSPTSASLWIGQSWLRGQFGLAFFTTEKEESWQRHARIWSTESSSSYNETELQYSTLGDPLVHSCLGHVRLARPVLDGSFRIDYALTTAGSGAAATGTSR